MYPKYKNNENTKSIQFKSLNNKKDQIANLMSSIIIKKNINLKHYKNDIVKYVSKRINESELDSHLKSNLEKEVLDHFLNKQNLNQTYNNASLNVKEDKELKLPKIYEKPQIPKDDYDVEINLNDLQLKSIPNDEKPKNLYNMITKLNDELFNEEKIKIQKLSKIKKKNYKEELEDQLREKKKIVNT